MTVYTCSPDLASILTCIYEAWNSRLGYRNVRLMTEPVGNLELFCDYCHHPDSPGIQLFLSVMVYVLRIHFFEGSR